MGQGQNVANKLFSELDFEPKFKLKEDINHDDGFHEEEEEQTRRQKTRK